MGLQLSGSVQLEGNLLVTGSANSVFENVLVTGTLVAQEIETQLVSSSIIYSSGSNKFGDLVTDKHQFTGSVDVSGSLTVNGPLGATTLVKTGGTSTQFLKADGSVDTNTYALNSSLSNYLPLTGGTLTGALNGTSASFTGGITVSQSVFTHASTPIRLNNLGGQYTQLDFLNNNTQKGAIWWDNTANSLNLWTGTTALTLASTGAATFSSSLQGNRFFSVGSLNSTDGSFYIDHPGIQTWKIGITNSNTSTFSIGNDNGGAFANKVFNITNSSNVGIGTSSPSGRLEVVPENANGNEGIFINQLGSRQSTIRFKSAHDANSDYRIGASILVDSAFEIYSVAAAASRMVITSGGNTQPGTDNAYSLGVSGTRWSAVWAANGTIQTSDEREKKDIVESDLGLDFVSKLRPVSFKWKVGKNVVTSEVVKDEDGNPILDEEGNEKTESVIIPREGKRTHYGLIAQEVEELLDGKDFGGFIHDEETDIKGLRYDQFVPLLIKSIQELKTEIDSLKNQMQ